MKTSTSVRRIRRIAEGQHGRVTWEQMLGTGASAHHLKQWVADGWLVQEHRGVYVVGHRPRGRHGTFAAALLAVGPSAALSWESAAGVWDVLRGPLRTEVTVPRAAGREHRAGIVIHRADLTAEQITVHDGLRVTSLARTHIDLAARLTPRRLDRMFEQAQVLHHLDPDVLGAEVICRRGCRGAPALRALLEGAVDPAAVRSILELRFLKVCAEAGIERPLVNVDLGPWVPDFLWPEARVVVETDGIAFHRTVAARRRDAEKDAWLRAAGYRVVRLTWQDVADRPAASAARVAAALRGEGE